MPRLGEFERIARYFAPLVVGQEDALGLEDDAAVVTPPAGQQLVITTDALVAGVHFLPDDPPDLLARKALRVNVSDLAAMGATPYGYTLAMALPRTMSDPEGWLEAFTRGLATDHEALSIRLLGGDSVATPGPLTLSVTAVGWVQMGAALRRNAARPGDDIYVSGTIGDATLGLRVLRGEFRGQEAEMVRYLALRYRLPEPRPALGASLRGRAHAAMDVSDGLIQDLGHICETSGCGAVIESGRVPLSRAARTLVEAGAAALADLMAGGDDYELLFTAPPERRGQIADAAAEAGVAVAAIGRMVESGGVRVLDEAGAEMRIERRGYTHA